MSEQIEAQQTEGQQAEAGVISEAKEKMAEVVPTPPKPTSKASAQSLKERLQWGEPGLTIIDTRNRESFLAERIKGAMLIDDVSNLPENREIYLYGDQDQNTAKVADQLRQKGFESISEIQGGLAGWKAVEGSTEGRVA